MKDCWRHLCAEIKQGRASSGFGRESDLAEAPAELFAAQWLAGPLSRKEPGCVEVVRHHGVLVIVGDVDELEDQAVERWWQPQGSPVEAEGDAVRVVDDMCRGESAGPRGVLATEQDHQPGDAVPGLDGVIVQESPGGRPAFVGVERAVKDPPRSGRDTDPGGELAADCPSNERSRVIGALMVLRGEPEVDDGLSAGRQGFFLFLDPDQEGDGLGDLGLAMSLV